MVSKVSTLLGNSIWRSRRRWQLRYFYHAQRSLSSTCFQAISRASGVMWGAEMLCPVILMLSLMFLVHGKATTSLEIFEGGPSGGQYGVLRVADIPGRYVREPQVKW